MAIWGATAILIFVGYQPPKRHTLYDHLSWFQKLRALDLPGFFLLTAGLSLFLAGLNLGGGLYAWTNVRVLATIIVGLVVLIAFALYEWLGTKEGISCIMTYSEVEGTPAKHSPSALASSSLRA